MTRFWSTRRVFGCSVASRCITGGPGSPQGSSRDAGARCREPTRLVASRGHAWADMHRTSAREGRQQRADFGSSRTSRLIVARRRVRPRVQRATPRRRRSGERNGLAVDRLVQDCAVAQEVAVAVVLDRAGERRVGRPFEGVVVAALGEAVHEEAREDRASAFITAVPSTGSVVGDKVWTGFGRYRRGVHPTVQCSMDGQLRRPGGAPRHDVGSVPHQDVGTVCRRALLLARVRAGARAAARSRPLARSDSRLNISSRRS